MTNLKMKKNKKIIKTRFIFAAISYAMGLTMFPAYFYAIRLDFKLAMMIQFLIIFSFGYATNLLLKGIAENTNVK